MLATEEGVGGLLWLELPKSKKAPKNVRRAFDQGAELVFVWGGEGMGPRRSRAWRGRCRR
jgi:hypothetical protein